MAQINISTYMSKYDLSPGIVKKHIRTGNFYDGWKPTKVNGVTILNK